MFILLMLLRFNDPPASLNLNHIIQVLKYLDTNDMIRKDNNRLCADFMDLGMGSEIDTMQFEINYSGNTLKRDQWKGYF